MVIILSQNRQSVKYLSAFFVCKYTQNLVSVRLPFPHDIFRSSADKIIAEQHRRNSKKIPKHRIKQAHLPHYIQKSVGVVPNPHSKADIHNPPHRKFYQRDIHAAIGAFYPQALTIMPQIAPMHYHQTDSARQHHGPVGVTAPDYFKQSVTHRTG